MGLGVGYVAVNVATSISRACGATTETQKAVAGFTTAATFAVDPLGSTIGGARQLQKIARQEQREARSDSARRHD